MPPDPFDFGPAFDAWLSTIHCELCGELLSPESLDRHATVCPQCSAAVADICTVPGCPLQKEPQSRFCLTHREACARLEAFARRLRVL